MNEHHASAAEYARSILDAGSASAVSKATYLGAGVTVGGSLSMNQMVGLAGLVLTLLTFAVDWYYKHKLTKAEIEAMAAREAREQAEHNARMGLYE
jgi:hypothetical protein